MTATFESNHTWRNMHETEPPVTSERFYTVRNRRADGSTDPQNGWRPGFEALQQVVRDAEAANKRVRALGGLWSLSPVAILQDYVIDTTNLTERVLNLPAGAVSSQPGQDRRFVFAQAGTRIVDFHERLMAAGLTLPTCGASNGQTLAGAISTGTHGAAIDVGAMQDYVVGIHLIGAAGRHVWLERASRPVATPAFAAMLGAELVRDDAFFNAAVVSFGSFGVVHAYMLEVTRAFSLEQYVKKVDFATAIEAVTGGVLSFGALQLPLGNERPFHFEFVVDPYNRGNGEQGTFARVMYARPFEALPPASATTSSTPSASTLSTIADIVNALPNGISRLALKHAVPFFLAQQVPLVTGEIATPAKIFGDTSLRTGGISMELGFELPDVPRAAAILGDAAERHLYAGVLAFRFVKSSAATLAFTRGPLAATTPNPPSRIICTVETDALMTDGTMAAFDAFWRDLDTAGIRYTLHWGQKLRQDAAWVRRAYGPALDAWLAQRRAWLPTPEARRLFSNALTDQMQLST